MTFSALFSNELKGQTTLGMIPQINIYNPIKVRPIKFALTLPGLKFDGFQNPKRGSFIKNYRETLCSNS